MTGSGVTAISVGNITVAGGGNGNIAIASNPVFIGRGLGTWPNRPGNDDWRWRNRFGNGIWGWPSTISVGNLTVAGSGNGNIAIASNPVFISSGVWHWPGHINNWFWFKSDRMNNGHSRWPNRFGNGVWGWPRFISVGNLTIARSGDNVAIVSNPSSSSAAALWFVPPDRNHDRDWFDHNDRDQGDRNQGDRDHDGDQRMQSVSAQGGGSDVEPLAVNGSVASEAPSKIEPAGSDEQPTLAINGGLAVEQQPADSMQPPSDGAMQLPDESVQSPSERRYRATERGHR